MYNAQTTESILQLKFEVSDTTCPQPTFASIVKETCTNDWDYFEGETEGERVREHVPRKIDKNKFSKLVKK